MTTEHRLCNHHSSTGALDEELIHCSHCGQWYWGQYPTYSQTYTTITPHAHTPIISVPIETLDHLKNEVKELNKQVYELTVKMDFVLEYLSQYVPTNILKERLDSSNNIPPNSNPD